MKAVGTGYHRTHGLATLALATPVSCGLIICLTRLQGLRSRGQTLRKWPQDLASPLAARIGSHLWQPGRLQAYRKAKVRGQALGALDDFLLQKPKSAFNTVRLPCGKHGICSENSCGTHSLRFLKPEV